MRGRGREGVRVSKGERGRDSVLDTKSSRRLIPMTVSKKLVAIDRLVCHYMMGRRIYRWIQ